MQEALEPGTRVEVRGKFERTWSSGFLVEERTAGGYHVRRRSDGAVLPHEFSPDDVRPERNRSMWWV